MANPESTTALVPATPVEGEYQLEVRDFTPAGKIDTFRIGFPRETGIELSPFMEAAVLKNTTWKDKAFPIVLHAVYYARRFGLDIMAGDVYMAEEGRFSTTADAKIRHALGTGRIAGYKVVIEPGPVVKIPYQVRGKDEVYEGSNLKATVTVKVKGWEEPVVYSTTLREWFTGRNPNWRFRPEYMLRKNALSKALSEVAPMGVEADEAPPAEPDAAPTRALAAAKATIDATPNPKSEKE